MERKKKPASDLKMKIYNESLSRGEKKYVYVKRGKKKDIYIKSILLLYKIDLKWLLCKKKRDSAVN